jgi:hypothetical protein
MSSTNPPRDPSGAPDSVVQDREAIELMTKKCHEAYRRLSEKTCPAEDDDLGKLILGKVINVLLHALNDKVFEASLGVRFQRSSLWHEEPVEQVREFLVHAIRASDVKLIQRAMALAFGNHILTQEVEKYFYVSRNHVAKQVLELVQKAKAANNSVESAANPQADGMSDKFRTDSMSSKRQLQFYQNTKKTLKRLEKSEKGFKKLPLQTKLRKVYQTSEDKCSRSTEGFIKKFTRCQQKFSPKQTPSASTEGETNELPADTGDPSHVTTMNTEDGAAKSLVVLRQGRTERKMRWSAEEIGALQKIMDSPEFRKRRTLAKRTKFTHARYQKLFPGRQRTEEAIRNQVKKLLSTIPDDSDDVSEEEIEEESEEDKEGTEREAARNTTEEAKKREHEEEAKRKATEAEEAVRIKANKPRDEVLEPASPELQGPGDHVNDGDDGVDDGVQTAVKEHADWNSSDGKKDSELLWKLATESLRMNTRIAWKDIVNHAEFSRTYYQSQLSNRWHNMRRENSTDDVSEEGIEEESEEDKEGTEREAARKTTEEAKKREHEEEAKRKAAETEEAVRIKANKPRDEVRAVQAKRQKMTPGSPRNRRPVSKHESGQEGARKKAEKEIPMDKSSHEIERNKSNQVVCRSKRKTRASHPLYNDADGHDDNDADGSDDNESSSSSSKDDVSEEEEESEEGSKEESDEKLINGTFRKNQTVYVKGVCCLLHGRGPDNKGGDKHETSLFGDEFLPRRLKNGSFCAPSLWRGNVQSYDPEKDMYRVALFGHSMLQPEEGSLFPRNQIFEQVDEKKEIRKYSNLMKEGKRNVVYENMHGIDGSDLGQSCTTRNYYYAPLCVPKDEPNEPNKRSAYFHSLCGECHSDTITSCNPILRCETCDKAYAHVKCMNLEREPEHWSCPACAFYGEPAKAACIICDRSVGLLLPVVKKVKKSDACRPSGSVVKDDGGVEWVHSSCAMVTAGFDRDTVKQEQEQGWVYFPKKRKEAKDAPACEICHKTTGIRVRCNNFEGTGRTKKICGRAFHAMCAIDRKDHLVRGTFENRKKQLLPQKTDFRCKGCFEDPFMPGDL